MMRQAREAVAGRSNLKIRAANEAATASEIRGLEPM